MEKAYNPIFFIIFSLIFFFISLSLSAQDASPALFAEIIDANSKIKSVEAEIIQYINTPEHAREVFKGKYFADNNGRFRIEYTSPSRQTVLNNGTDLFWYYPDDNILYTIDRDQGPRNESAINPLKEFHKTDLKKDYSISYLGKHFYGFFIPAYNFRIKDIKNNLFFNIWANAGNKLLLAKIITNDDGIEIIKELYGDYEKIKNIHFPKRIDVFARTGNGVTKNTTKYSNIKLNFSIPESMFKMKLPENVEKKHFN